MSDYDYKEGKLRILSILEDNLTVNENVRIPSDRLFTYENSYYGWVTAVFVDIRDSTSIFSSNNKVNVSKIIRSFTSEVIEILREDDNLREIGIRGDCVYSVYATQNKEDINEIMNKVYYINTFMKMLNSLLKSKGFKELKVGIGASSSQELVIKAGRKGTGINNLVWIGEGVSRASNLSSLGNRNFSESIVISSATYSNYIDTLSNQDKDRYRSYFKYKSSSDYGEYYYCDIIKSAFNDWIDGGMN